MKTSMFQSSKNSIPMVDFLRRAILACFSIHIFLSSSAYAQSTCKSYSFTNNKVFSSCNDLPYLNSFLHWNYNPTAKSVEIAYRHSKLSSNRRWVAWSINPTGNGMIGTQAFVAHLLTNGSMKVYKSPVSGTDTTLAEGELSFPVGDLSASYLNNEITIFATFELPNNITTVNQVWQEGPLSSTDAPRQHDVSGQNIQSKGSIDLLSGQTVNTGGSEGNSKIRRRNIHGVLNAVSWGIMMPLGALIARYLKVFKSADPTWFYLHVGCQSSAYIIGVAGWALGIKLGSESSGVQYDGHRNIGILLFCLGTLQVFALLLRPRPNHKYRLFWNIYHHSVGYLVILLSIINIFKGFDILDPEKKWKSAYIVIISIMVFLAVCLEAYTWFIVIKRKKLESEGKNPQVVNGGANGVNGYGVRAQSGAV